MSSLNVGSPRTQADFGWWRRLPEFAPSVATPRRCSWSYQSRWTSSPVSTSSLRVRVDAAPGVVEQAYSVSSSSWPPSSTIDITVRDVPGGRVSPLLARRVAAGDQLHLHGPFGSLTWDGVDAGPLMMIGAGSGVAPFASIVRSASARQSTTPMALLCSSRDRTTALFREELDELDHREVRLSVIHTFTRTRETSRLTIIAASMRQ